jgi:hypothetical protein
VRSSGTVDGDSQASAAASSPAPSLEEEPSDELGLLPNAADLLEEASDPEIDDEGRTERVRSSGTVDGDSQASAAASSPAPSLEEEPSDEATALGAEAEEEDRDPNAATQPDREPLAVTAPPENVAEVEFEATELEATEAENLEEMQPPGSVDGIPVDELDGSPDDEIQIQSGAESLFEKAGADLSQYDDESER